MYKSDQDAEGLSWGRWRPPLPLRQGGGMSARPPPGQTPGAPGAPSGPSRTREEGRAVAGDFRPAPRSGLQPRSLQAVFTLTLRAYKSSPYPGRREARLPPFPGASRLSSASLRDPPDAPEEVKKKCRAATGKPGSLVRRRPERGFEGRPAPAEGAGMPGNTRNCPAGRRLGRSWPSWRGPGFGAAEAAAAGRRRHSDPGRRPGVARCVERAVSLECAIVRECRRSLESLGERSLGGLPAARDRRKCPSNLYFSVMQTNWGSRF